MSAAAVLSAVLTAGVAYGGLVVALGWAARLARWHWWAGALVVAAAIAATVPRFEGIAAGAATVVAGGVVLISLAALERSLVGLAARAAIHDPTAVAILGIDPTRAALVAGLVASIAAAAATPLAAAVTPEPVGAVTIVKAAALAWLSATYAPRRRFATGAAFGAGESVLRAVVPEAASLSSLLLVVVTVVAAVRRPSVRP